ncbi:hypothetical protein VTK56DRAFT_482 [Thermocarpiscus australiensis]
MLAPGQIRLIQSAARSKAGFTQSKVSCQTSSANPDRYTDGPIEAAGCCVAQRQFTSHSRCGSCPRMLPAKPHPRPQRPFISLTRLSLPSDHVCAYPIGCSGDRRLIEACVESLEDGKLFLPWWLSVSIRRQLRPGQVVFPADCLPSQLKGEKGGWGSSSTLAEPPFHVA